MRGRVGVGASLAAFALFGAAACGFGVDLDGLFGEAPGDGGSMDGSVEAGDGGMPMEAGIPSIQVTTLALGANYGCGRRIDGTVMCWGQDTGIGELGDGLKHSSSTPVLVKDVADAIELAVGQHHACIVHKSGTVSCWGENGDRELGDGTTTNSPTPKDVVSLVDVQKVALGGAFSCALKKDGTVQCWGDNAAGQLGDGTVTPRSQPAPVTGVAGATQIIATDGTACALVKSGEVYCWGHNNIGQGGAPPPDLKLAVKVAGLTGVAAIGAGPTADHICAVRTAGDIQCWGYGNSGSLGNAKSSNSAMPVPALTINDGAGVTTGDGFSCAWRKSGAVACWGSNGWKQLGLGDMAPTDDVSTPLPVNGLAGIEQMAAGEAHVCALSGKGTKISCWGTNVGHGLGRGTRVQADLPLKVAGSSTFVRFGMGPSHTCAIDGAGALFCWGNNEYRQQSVTTFLASGTPGAVTGISGVTRVGAGQYHTCIVGSGGVVQCWGGGEYGNLGNGSSPYVENMPQIYGGPGPKTDIGAGSYFTCALLGSNDVTCAGSNDGDRLGYGGSSTSTPVIVPGMAVPDAGPEAGVPGIGATKMSVGPGHTCVIRAGGVVTCWGYDDGGECGQPKTYASTPADVALPLPAIDLAAGGGHTCVVLQDGSVRCFGYNDHGQVTGGDPDGPALRTPGLGGKKAKGIVAGDDHACALLEDNSVVCWGKGTNGQLGNGVRADQTSPTAVKNLAGVKVLAAGGNRTCATLADNSAYCWGDNRSGELGDGVVMTTGAAAPVVGY